MSRTPRSAIVFGVGAALLVGVGLTAWVVSRSAPEPVSVAGPASVTRADEAAADTLLHAESRDEPRVVPTTRSDATSAATGETGSGLVLHHGLVIDDRDERPVAGALVHFASAPSGAAAAATDDDGRFALPLPDGVPCPALLEAPGYARLLFGADPQHGDAGAPDVLRLRRGARLRARVLAASGGGLPGVEVVLRAAAAELVHVEGRVSNSFVLPDETWRARTDVQGEALLADLPPGAELFVELRADGRTLLQPGLPVLLASGEEAVREFVLGTGATILGRVRDDAGAPVADAEIWRLRGVANMVAVLRPDQRTSVLQKATTDAGGAFELHDVQPGTWWVGVAPSEAFAGDAATVHVTPATFFPEVELVVHRGLFLRGTVIGPDGPVAFAQVQARQLDGRLVYVSGLAREGRFTLGPLVPGTYEVGAGADGLIGAAVTAEAGDEDVRLSMEAGRVLRGRVVDAATGAPVSATVRVQPTSSEHVVGSIGRPPEVGTEFAFRDLLPVEYGLVACTPDGRVGVLRAVAAPAGSAATYELAVEPGAILALRVADGARRGFATIWLDDVMIFGNGIGGGGQLDVPVPAGALVLEWRQFSGEPVVRTVGGAAGARIEVVLGDG